MQPHLVPPLKSDSGFASRRAGVLALKTALSKKWEELRKLLVDPKARLQLHVSKWFSLACTATNGEQFFQEEERLKARLDDSEAFGC